MFEHSTETEAREKILAAVQAYCERFHNKKKEFRPGDRISYASRVYDYREMVNLVDLSLIHILFSREESQIASSPRHEMEVHCRLGADRTGKIRAIDLYLSLIHIYRDYLSSDR